MTQTHTCVPMLIAALFTVAKLYKRCKYHLRKEWINKIFSMCTTEYYSAIKNKSSSYTCYNMDYPWKHLAKWNKTGTREQILCISMYMKYL